jgi:hypothetical protein
VHSTAQTVNAYKAGTTEERMLLGESELQRVAVQARRTMCFPRVVGRGGDARQVGSCTLVRLRLREAS